MRQYDKKRIKKGVLSIKPRRKALSIISISVALFISVAFIANANDSFNWYCKRTKDHSQPPLPAEFEFINELGGIYIDKNNSDPSANEKRIFLTFDAGYENGNIEKILSVLKENDVKGAFFILSNLITSSPALVKRMADEGHLVCNHTSTHKDVSRICDKEAFSQELKKLEKLYKDCTGREMSKYFRPPEGRFSRTSLKYAYDLGYKTVFWSFAYADWDNNNQMSQEAAKAKILDNIHNGAVLLLHPTSETNALILDDIIKELKADGYTFGSLDELS